MPCDRGSFDVKRWSCSFGQWGVRPCAYVGCRDRPADPSGSPARELLHGGARFVVVGGAARWLLGESAAPRDLDVAVKDAMVPALVAALDGIGVTRSAVSIRRARQVHLETSWTVGCVPWPGDVARHRGWGWHGAHSCVRFVRHPPSGRPSVRARR